MTPRKRAHTPVLTRLVRLGAGAALGLLCGAGLVHAAGGTLAGKITDPQGAPIPGVIVTATETRTRAVQTTTTDRGGEYALSNLEGTYRVETRLAGFARFSREA